MSAITFWGVFGSEQKCRAAFTETYPSLCLFAFRILKDMQEAEDVVQDVFVVMMTKSDTLTNKELVKSYMYRAVNNACLNIIRHKNYVRARIDSYVEEVVHDEEEYVLDAIESRVLEKIFAQIDELPPECRKVFEYSYIRGYNVEKVAEELNISVNTVKTQRMRARKFLQYRLKDIFAIAVIVFRI